jgi:hypothetical protein
MKIKYLPMLVALLLSSTSCIYKDLSKTLHYSYADSDKIGVQNIQFQDLRDMKKGTACAYNLLYVFPIGDTSIMSAARVGQINKVLFIGESGYWTFPFSKTCTVAFGN